MDYDIEMMDLLTPAVGMKEIAAKAGVSIATVSMSLSDHPQISRRTRQRIRQISQQMGYQPPRRATRPRSARPRLQASLPERIGFMLLGSPLDSEIKQYTLYDLTTASANQGIRMEVYCVENPDQIAAKHDDILQFAAGVDALILTGYVTANLLEELEAKAVPHILYGTVWGDDHAWTGLYGQIIISDSVAMAHRATSILLEEGHRRIAFISGRTPPGLCNDRWRRGYRYALLDAGMAMEEALICVGRPDDSPSYAPIAAKAVHTLTSLPSPPTAFVFPDVEMAMTFMAAMKQSGHSLSAESIISGGYNSGRYNQPPASFRTLGYEGSQIAELIVRHLCQLHAKPEPCPTRVTVPFHVAPPRTVRR